jgi:hypothetical protein
MKDAAPKMSGKRARAVRDLRIAAAAIVILAVCGGTWIWMSADASERREKVLASMPAFPARGQEQRRPAHVARGSERLPAPPSAPPPPRDLAKPVKLDSMTSFVLKPAHGVALVHVNALLNTPLFARIKECVPTDWGEMTRAMADLGVDLERDLDRLAITGEGMALSGFFDGKPIARNIASQWDDFEEQRYRDQQLWLTKDMGVAQVGNLVLVGPRDSMSMLLDRALDPTPEGADPQDIYGDVFMRTDFSAFRDVFMRSDTSDFHGSGARGNDRTSDAIGAVLDALNGVTLRANVWDVVALSIEGKPRAGQDMRDLAAMARGAISIVREQLDPNDVELATLVDLAKVNATNDGLNIDLALPVSDVFDKLHFPCPGAEKTRAGEASR